MMYEHNYEIALHAQSRFGDRIRSVIVPWPSITDNELDILTKAGVVGYRITWRLTKEIDQKMVARTTERGWSMHYLHRADEEQMDGWKPQILKTPGKFVLEHMGGVDPAKGIDGEGFKFVLQGARHRPLLGEAVAAHLQAGQLPVLRHRSAGEEARAARAERGCCGARTGRIRNTSSRCRTTSPCSTSARLGARRETRKLIFVDNPAEAFGFPPL
jgi:hypothetical protein